MILLLARPLLALTVDSLSTSSSLLSLPPPQHLFAHCKFFFVMWFFTSQIIMRTRRWMLNGSRIPKEGFERRRAYFNHKQDGLLVEKVCFFSASVLSSRNIIH